MKWTPLLVIVLILSVGSNVYLAMRHPPSVQTDFAKQYAELRSEYISLAESHKNTIELMFTKLDMKEEFGKLFDGAYSNISDEEFQEAVRRKIVRLEMRIQELKKE